MDDVPAPYRRLAAAVLLDAWELLRHEWAGRERREKERALARDEALVWIESETFIDWCKLAGVEPMLAVDGVQHGHLDKCIYPGCEEPYSGSGWCMGHLQQHMKGAGMRPLRKRRPNGATAVCEVEGCEGRPKARGLCQACYSKDQYRRKAGKALIDWGEFRERMFAKGKGLPTPADERLVDDLLRDGLGDPCRDDCQRPLGDRRGSFACK